MIYFYQVVGATIYLLTCYAKSEQADLSPEVKKHLRNIVEQLKKGESEYD